MVVRSTSRLRQRDTVCSVTANRAAWELQVLAAVDAGKNIAIASGSAKEVATLQQMLLNKRPTVRVQSYTAKTDPVIKERCFADVNAEWVQYQVVLLAVSRPVPRSCRKCACASMEAAYPVEAGLRGPCFLRSTPCWPGGHRQPVASKVLCRPFHWWY